MTNVDFQQAVVAMGLVPIRINLFRNQRERLRSNEVRLSPYPGIPYSAPAREYL